MQPCDDQRPTSFPPSELTQRLLQRATQPVGMIDVRHGENIYGRTAGWVAQRFSLLEHWRSRYAVDQGPSPAAQPPVMKSPPMPLVESHSMTKSIQASSVAEPAALMRSIQPGSASPAPSMSLPVESPAAQELKLRVKRPSMALSSTPMREASSNPQTSPGMLLQREPVEDSPSVVAAKTENIPASESLPQVREIPSVSAAPQMHLQRKTLEAVGHGVADFPHSFSLSGIQPISSEAAPKIDSAAGKQMHLQRADVQAVAASPPSPVIEPLPRAVEITAGNNHSPALRLQRKAIQPDLSATAFSDGNGAGAATDSRGPHMAVAQEIHVASAPGTEPMIWRKADPNARAVRAAWPAPTPAAAGQLMRQSDSSSAPSASPVAPAAAPAASGNNGMNVARVAEQVSRIIARQLAIERERRGKTR